MNQPLTPENVLSNDPGDETQRRFRYQAAYAAIQCLSLLEEDPENVFIYCEHHEDVLVKKKNETFIGIQVKTRATGKEPFKANDNEMQNSIKRFIEHEINFANSFCRYLIAANCGFWHEKKNGANLHYILELCQKETEIDLEKINKTLKDFINKIYKALNTSSTSLEIIIKVLRKISLHSSPGLDDIEGSLLRRLSQVPSIKDLRVDQVNRVTRSLIDKCLNAASLVCDSPRESYYLLLCNPDAEKTTLIIQGKQISKEHILNLITTEVANDQSLLYPLNHIPISEMPKGMKRLELKMATGGISLNNIDITKDFKSSAESQSLTWLRKYGRAKAEEQYQHIKAIVRNECQEAYDLTKIDDSLFGQKMLIQVRERLHLLHNRDTYSLFGLRYEHLLGMAGILTEECKIWWSKEFDILDIYGEKDL
ncbi:MAG: DUF4297 domain-containing protein [Aphanothece sp. CMT-3BRIN-NPC111]|jgi:hypothetical protein|nr:DUF4297 domain-containing protein [Aphanothece sp. CMT-3BRIN-NPC111]